MSLVARTRVKKTSIIFSRYCYLTCLTTGYPISCLVALIIVGVLIKFVCKYTGTIPNRFLIDCEDTTCRYQQLVCPESDNCTVYCYDSRPYACFRTDVFCPSGGGDCTVNCDNSHACIQANTTCPQGNCAVNCQNDFTCQTSVLRCSGDTCFLDCRGQESCSNSVIECSTGNCTLNCTHYYSCRDSTVYCSPYGLCTVNCYSDSNQFTHRICYQLKLFCPANGNCIFNFDGRSYGHRLGDDIAVTCKENSSCAIRCTSSYYSTCYSSHITCPRYSGDCTVECSGNSACQESTIECGPGRDCLSCSGKYSCDNSTLRLYSIDTANLNCSGPWSCRYSNIGCQNNDCIVTCAGDTACQHARFTCSDRNGCIINCVAQSTCQYASFTCLTSDECTINCAEESTCQYASFTCPANNNCTINCDGQYSCQNARVTCPTGDYSCNILCTDPLSCQNLSVTNTHNVNLLCCGGETACAGTSVVPVSTDCPYIT